MNDGPRTNIQAPSILLVGETGAGKTYAIKTLLEAGLSVFVIGTEPTFLDTLLDATPPSLLSRLHWRAITPARVGIKGLQDMVKKVTAMDFDALSKMRPDSGRAQAQIIKLLATLEDFRDDRTGESFGPVEAWPATHALVIDSLSGINLMAMDVTIGNKVTAHQGEWGVAMGLIDKLVLNLTSNLRCFFVLTAHLERETDELTQGSKMMPATLGRKLAPRLPRFFSEVVMAYREGKEYFWSTAQTGVVLKHRALPLGAKLEPSFGPIVQAHHRRLGAVARQPREE
jgi:hypothetical protein